MDDQNRKLHSVQHENRIGQVAPLTWLGHPSVRRQVEEDRVVARGIVEPLGRLLRDPESIALFSAKILDMGATRPAGEEHANPFIRWELDEDERECAPWVILAFRGFLACMAADLAEGGVPIDPHAPECQLVLAQLLLRDVDFTLPPDDLIKALYLAPPANYSAGAPPSEHSRRVADKLDRIVRAIGHAHWECPGKVHIAAPYTTEDSPDFH